MSELTELTEELEAVLVALQPEVSEVYITDTRALARGGEFAIALENLCENLYGAEAPISSDLKATIAAYARKVGVGESYWNWLVREPAELQGWSHASELLEVLGASEDDPRVQAMSRAYGLERDEMSGVSYLESETKGLSAMIKGGAVSALFFHGEGKDGFSAFSGSLIKGLSFASTAQEVRAVLGSPRLERFEGVPGTAKMEQFIIEGKLLASFDYREDGALWMLTIEVSRRPIDS